MSINSLTVPQRYYLGAAAVILATLVGTILAYPQLPSIVPLHWDAQGHANSFGPKWSLFFYTPGLMVGIVSMFVALPWFSPKRFEVNSFRPSHLYLMIVIVALLSYSQLLVLISGLGFAVDVSRAIEGGVCLLILLLGCVPAKKFVAMPMWRRSCGDAHVETAAFGRPSEGEAERPRRQ